MQQATLCLLVKDDKIVLAMKKRGFGTGKPNGYGGKVQPGETTEQAAVRELYEEAGIRAVPEDLKKMGEITYLFPTVPAEKNWNQVVHVYIITRWEGEPQETEEMKPEWYALAGLPLEKM
jgi:8-oxo-dGTP diphosphatase